MLLHSKLNSTNGNDFILPKKKVFNHNDHNESMRLK